MIRRPLSSLKLKQTDIEEMDANMCRVQKPKDPLTTNSEGLRETELKGDSQKMDISDDS